MAEQENNVPTPTGEDTQTRKTVKLKAPATPAASLGSTPGGIADPLSGRDTDTGNLEVLSDTQTRKTVKLKPIAPGSSPLGAPGASMSAAGANTNTRKVVMLKSTPEKNTPIDPVAAAAPAPATEENDETVKVKKVAAPAMPADSFKDDATVKLKRPENAVPGMRPGAPPAAPAAPVAPAAAPGLAPQATVAAPTGGAAQTIGIKKPEIVKKAEPEVPAAAPAAEPAAEPKDKKKREKASLGMKATEAPAGQPPMVADMANQLAGRKKGAGAPSALYTVVALVTLLCLIFTAALTVVQYFNILQAQNIELPLLSDRIK